MQDEQTGLLSIPGLRALLSTRFAANASHQMLGVCVGWQVYELTGSPLQIAMIGLAQFFPTLLLTLAAGQATDRYVRKVILRNAYAAQVASSGALLALALTPQPPLLAIYAALLVGSAARAYELPALHATLASLVPRPLLGRAVSAYSSSGKLSQLIGPALGGVVYGIGGAGMAFGCAFALFVTAFLGALTLPQHHTPVVNDEKGWRSAFAGLHFILTTKPLLGVMILDLVATLFGGVAAVLPIFARDILDIGPLGLGLLRSAPALGGFTLAVIMARRALPFGMAATMFGGLLFYGTMTIAFGLSTNAILSFIVLLGVGMGDMLSGVVRQTAMQLWTPDDKRGRVLAVSTMSGQSANQLGTIEAGIAAELLGASGSVVFGGLAVYAAVALCYWTFPAIRRIDAPLKV